MLITKPFRYNNFICCGLLSSAPRCLGPINARLFCPKTKQTLYSWQRETTPMSCQGGSDNLAFSSQSYLGYKSKNNWLIIDIIILRNSNCVTCLKTLVSNKYFSVILRFLTKICYSLEKKTFLVILRSLKTQIMGLWLRLCRCGFIRQQTSCHHICF